MNKILIAAIAGAALAATGPVMAKGKDTTGNPGKGNQGCTLDLGGDFKNPGKMFQYLRTREQGASGNPKDIVDAYPNAGWGNVGGLIADKCAMD